MKRKKQLGILIILLLVIQQFAYNQNERQYKKWILKSINIKINVDSFSIRNAYNLTKNSVLLFGVSEKLFKTGVEVIQYNNKTKKINYKDISGGSDDFIYPHFYNTNDTLDPQIMLCTSGADYTYGVTVYKILKDKIEKIGYMNLALNVNLEKDWDDPAPYVIITTNGKSITFSFKKTVATNCR